MNLLCAGSWNTCGAATGVLLVQREGSGTLLRQQHHTPWCAEATFSWQVHLLPYEIMASLLKLLAHHKTLSDCYVPSFNVCYKRIMENRAYCSFSCNTGLKILLRHLLWSPDQIRQQQSSRENSPLFAQRMVCLMYMAHNAAPKSPCKGTLTPLLGNHGCIYHTGLPLLYASFLYRWRQHQ